MLPTLLALSLSSPALAHGDKAYTMEDITALVENEGWQEILSHANDIAPRDRKDQWKKAVEAAGIGALENAKMKNPQEAFGAAYSLPDQFPTLKKSKRFMKLRSSVGVESMDECFKQRYGIGQCMKILDSFLAADPKNADAHLKAGKMVRLRTTPHASAAPYFAKALRAQKDKKAVRSYCADDDLRLAAISGLGQPSDWPQVKDANEIIFKHCYKELGDRAFEEFLEGGTYVALNTCDQWKKKKRKLSAFQKAHCKDKKSK